MLQYLYSKPSKVVEPQKAINASCHAHGVERADESYQLLLLLHGASPPARFFEEEKVDLTLSE
jgi:hypothetical protein